MSRLAKKPIEIPKGVLVKIEGQAVNIKGPKGELKIELPKILSLEEKEGKLFMTVQSFEDRKQNEQWGLFASLVKNMVLGVEKGFEKKLEINGVGYKASVSGNKLILNVGFSHPVEFIFPKEIKIEVEKNVITIGGADKQLVGEISAQIRRIREPEPYKGKGIKYSDEIIHRKAGKAAA